MKEYNLNEGLEVNNSENLPVKVSPFGKLRKFFSFNLSEKQEKVVNEIKTFFTQEVDFSEFKTFWRNEFIFPSSKKSEAKENIIPDDNTNL